MNMLFASVDVVDLTRLPDLIVGLTLNTIAISAVAMLTHRRSASRANYVFTLVIVNVVVFFVTYLMSQAAVSTNVGFGLFALFGILRFRTGTLPVIEMTYLFAGIALASFNALAPTSLSLVEAVVANVVIIGVLELLGGVWLARQAEVHSITFERIELIHPSRRDELLADLEQRTGLAIRRVMIHDINFLNDTARLSIEVAPDSSTGLDTSKSRVRHVEAERYDP